MKKIILITEDQFEDQLNAGKMLFESAMGWEDVTEGESYAHLDYDYEEDKYVLINNLDQVDLLFKYLNEYNYNRLCVRGVITVNKIFSCYG
jgi:hypothetical protein